MRTPLPRILETKLAEFRRRVWLVKLTEGFLAALFGIGLSFLVVFALDRFFETPRIVRLFLLLAGAGSLGLGLPLKWHTWVWRQRRLEDAARLLRRTFPRLGDQLLGIVELARIDAAAGGQSERLVEAAMAQAASAVADKDFTHAIPHARHWQWAGAASCVLALGALAFGFFSEAARNALARWVAPWANVERFTFTRIESLPSRLVVPYAEPFTVPVRLAAETQRVPGEAKARIGKQPSVSAQPSSEGYVLSFPPQKQDVPMSLWIGDIKKTILVQPRVRPEVAELAVRLKLPEYLGYQTEPRIAVHGGAVSVLKGANAALEAKASSGLIAAEVDGHAQPVRGEWMVTNYVQVNADMERKFLWKDVEGLTPREALTLKLRAVEDEPPKIMARREALEQVVLDSEVVTFDLTASDDYGVKRAGLQWVGSATRDDEKTPITGEKVAVAGGNEQREMEARATFCATREGVAPQTLEIRAWAEDYLPGRKRALSAAFVIHVLNKTDHALWLTEQFGKWLVAAKESYEKEQQLHETNQELRELSAAELERPENRRRVSQQALAESGNAARLEGLTQSGRSLVEQATKNDEFDATRLESWATMLKSLKEIAGHRMPSVADLLKQSASAPSGRTGEAKAGGNSQPPQQQASAGKASQPQPSAPSVAQGQSSSGKPSAGAEIDPKATPKPVAPSLSDRETSLTKTEESKPADSATKKPPGGGKLSLPTTTLGAAPQTQKPASPGETPAQEKLENAVSEQKDLLAEFAKVADQLGNILGSLEASTFVKRLKAASRQQMAIASGINQKTLDAFGIEREPVKAAQPIVKQAKEQSEVVRVIQSDLDAYFQRKQDSRLKTILDEMKKTEIVRALARGGERVAVNLTGESISGAEYWADTLDRWSEELVAASNCKACSSCSGESLPPEIVLKVMQALRDEMKLRDETREAENARAAVGEQKHAADAAVLSEKQAAIGTHTDGAISDIRALPQGDEKFAKELKMLMAVVDIMDETHGILGTNDTGPKAIAAETEAIELLLQARRSSPNAGGGSGSNPGGGGRAAAASSAALAELGPGSDASSTATSRAVGQATGRAGKEYPEEFRSGLDAYFSLLESSGGGK